MSTVYTINSVVKSVELMERVIRGYKDAKGDTVLERETIGWFVCFEGSWEKLNFGKDKPELRPGQSVSRL